MNKMIAFVLSMTFVLALAGCGHQEQQSDSDNNVQYFFTGKVIEVNEEYLLVEVIDGGNSDLSDGIEVEVSTDVVAAQGCPDFVVDEYARVVMARNVDDTPSSRLEALSIYKADKTGNPINRLIYGPDFDPNADNSAHTINGELFTNLQDSDESGKPDETQQAIEQTPQIEAQQTLNPIVNIVDRTKTEGLPYDMAEEKFFEDGDNKYYFSGIYSHYVIVHYEDGSQEDIVTALNAGRATIADLDKFEVNYTAKSLGAETAKSDNGTVGNVTGIFDMLNELEYQPYTCDGLPEYLLAATDGTVYSINFSEKWVWRGSNEQAELSDELISQLKESKSLIVGDKPIEAQPDETIGQTEVEEIALNECKVNYDYIKAEFDTDKKTLGILGFGKIMRRLLHKQF